MPDIRGVKHPDKRTRKEHIEWLRYLKSIGDTKALTRYWIEYGKGISKKVFNEL